ncbi:HNH endonuclease [candidate division KSB1 bacterium]|nr:HNH endonuclease [candidate division KSB1 bacterium]
MILNSRSEDSPVNYNYSSIKLTYSRINKGLLAIPRSLKEFFPSFNTTLQIFFDNSASAELKPFTALTSSTRESRIGGLKNWFEKNAMKDGDDVIIQIIDTKNYIYRLIYESFFIHQTHIFQEKFDSAKTEAEVSEILQALADWTITDFNHVVLNELYRLSLNQEILDRKIVEIKPQRRRESVPSNLKVSLLQLYEGHCQICNFTFLKKDATPYFEIHHIKPEKGNHPKNLLVVCANCHRQFEFANVDLKYNGNGWLTNVNFNNFWFPVKQILTENELAFLKNVNFENL